jgi:hypothetical protein
LTAVSAALFGGGVVCDRISVNRFTNDTKQRLIAFGFKEISSSYYVYDGSRFQGRVVNAGIAIDLANVSKNSRWKILNCGIYDEALEIMRDINERCECIEFGNVHSAGKDPVIMSFPRKN